MMKRTRRKVTAYDIQPNQSPDELSRRLHAHIYTAILECGHRVPQGVDETRHRWKACFECDRPPLLCRNR